MQLVQVLLNNCENDEKTAIIHGVKKISYGELKVAIGSYSRYLVNVGVHEGDRVILFFEKSIEFVICMYACMSIGATYIPLDSKMPQDRLSYIIDNSNCKIVITNDKSLENNANVKQYIMVDELINASEENEETADFAVREIDGNRIMYIIYTSGSTGEPKGVMIKRRSVEVFIESIIELVKYSSKTVYLNVSPLYFDASVVDVFCTLSVNGTLVLMEKFVMPNKLMITLEKNRITDALLVPSVLKLITSKYVDLSKYDLSSLRTIWYGAETCPVSVLKTIKEKVSHLTFIHGYGPTEATHTTTVYIFDDFDDVKEEYMPIGKPLPNIEVMAVDKDGRQIGVGEVGELYISGEQLFAGYCNNEKKNKECIIDNFQSTGKRFYKTGDYVTIDENGNYFFRGRTDDMIKIAGKLVFLNEIERNLLSIDGIEEAYATSIEDKFFNSKIVAFVVLKEKDYISENAIRDYLKGKLQSYMIPAVIEMYDANDIPKTPNGKVDIKKMKKDLVAVYD